MKIFVNFIWDPVLRLHGISPMAMATPPNPPVTMYGYYVATGGKSYSEFHQWPSVDHRWKTPGHWWKLTIFEVITWYVAHLDAKKMEKNYMQFSWKFCYKVFQKSNYAIKSVKLLHFWRYCRSTSARLVDNCSLIWRKYQARQQQTKNSSLKNFI